MDVGRVCVESAVEFEPTGSHGLRLSCCDSRNATGVRLSPPHPCCRCSPSPGIRQRFNSPLVWAHLTAGFPVFLGKEPVPHFTESTSRYSFPAQWQIYRGLCSEVWKFCTMLNPIDSPSIWNPLKGMYWLLTNELLGQEAACIPTIWWLGEY